MFKIRGGGAGLAGRAGWLAGSMAGWQHGWLAGRFLFFLFLSFVIPIYLSTLSPPHPWKNCSIRGVFSSSFFSGAIYGWVCFDRSCIGIHTSMPFFFFSRILSYVYVTFFLVCCLDLVPGSHTSGVGLTCLSVLSLMMVIKQKTEHRSDLTPGMSFRHPIVCT